MEQSKLQSLNEASLNVAIGFAVAVLSQVVVFPLVGIHGVSLMTNVHIACYFTVISIVRSYAVRRWFNALQRRQARPDSEGMA